MLTSTPVPEEIWNRWNEPERESLRKVVIALGSSVSCEALVRFWPEVSIVPPGAQSPSLVKGIFYLTSRRIAFLPRNMIDEGMVVAEYNSLSCISGSGAELTISVVDMNGSSAEFKFPVLSALFECFGVLRALAEASRDKSVDLGKCVVDLANPSDTGQFVFSAIEVELGDHNQNTEVAPEIPVTEEAFDPLMKVLRPIKLFYDQINGMHFDIHVKLRILILISFVSTFLKWISFLPFCALAMMAFLLFTAWKSINKDPEEEEDASVCNVPTEAKGFMKTQKIMRDWLFWDDPRKGMILMYSVGAVFVGWLILPARVYRWACFLVWLGVMGRLIMKSEMGAMIFQGDCFLG